MLCYVMLLQLIYRGINILDVDTDEHGLIPDRLRTAIEGRGKDMKKPKMLYVVPSGGNPSTGTLTLHRKQQIYKVMCHMKFSNIY